MTSKLKSTDTESSLSGSCDDLPYVNIIKDINIKYENRNNKQMTNIKDLELLNELYECKKKLEKKKIIPYITDSDLIKFNNENADTLYLRLIKETIELNDSGNDSTNDLTIDIHNHIHLKSKHKKHKSDKRNYPSESPKKNYPSESPKKNYPSESPIKIKIQPSESPKKVMKSYESPKKVMRSHESPNKVMKSRESPKKVNSHSRINNIKEIPQKLSKHVIINDIDYIINYKTTDELHSLFKIENKYNQINCFGITDNLIKISNLIHNNYEVNSVEYDMHKYNIITPNFDEFISPMFIEIVTIDLKYTIETFMEILPNLIHKI